MSARPRVPGPRAGGTPAAGSGDPATRLRLRAYRNPLRLAVSAGLWRGAWYLVCYVLVTGWVLFALAFTAAAVAVMLAVTLAGIPLLAAAAGVVRGCANAERWRLRQVLTRPVRGSYRPVTRRGIVAQATTRWRDPATWRDVAYLIGLWAPLFILDTVVLTVWLTFLSGITLPAWYRFPRSDFSNGTSVHGVQLGYFPNGPHGAGGTGLYLDTLPKALLAAAGCLVLWLLFNYVLLITARAHATIARALLRPPPDPLAGAKEMLARPGPLPPLVPSPPL
ncbi:MAG TPA: sensor domain-containing protein [Streptosporangiaceae bacterium]|nr:sensor domain-containing protein [Streptosporangiaceae bacterium]